MVIELKDLFQAKDIWFYAFGGWLIYHIAGVVKLIE